MREKTQKEETLSSKTYEGSCWPWAIQELGDLWSEFLVAAPAVAWPEFGGGQLHLWFSSAKPR